MKKYILLQLLIFCLISASGQQRYYVSVVKGVVLGDHDKKITVGSRLRMDDGVFFGSPTAMLVLLDPKKGRIVAGPAYVKGKPSNIGRLSEFLQFQHTIVPLSTKSTAHEKQ